MEGKNDPPDLRGITPNAFNYIFDTIAREGAACGRGGTRASSWRCRYLHTRCTAGLPPPPHAAPARAQAPSHRRASPRFDARPQAAPRSSWCAPRTLRSTTRTSATCCPRTRRPSWTSRRAQTGERAPWHGPRACRPRVPLPRPCASARLINIGCAHAFVPRSPLLATNWSGAFT